MPQNRRRFRAALLFCIAVFGPFALKPAAGPLPDESFPPEFRWQALAGTRTGLYGLSFFGALIPLRTGGEVRKIIRAENRWITLGSEGILVSGDLRRWESRNRGLPRKTIKVFRDGTVSFERVVQEIKDLELNPFDSEIMACATKDRVFLSRDGGRSWRDLGMPAYRTNGIKAVAVTSLTGASGAPELCVFLSHSTYGIHILMPDRRGALWTELNGGIEPLETTGNADEVSDILCAAPEGNPVVYAAQTFRPRIYRLDWEGRRFERIWSGGEGFGTADSLSLHEDSLRFIREGAVVDIPRPGGPPPLRPERRREDLAALYRSLTGGEAPLCLGLWERGAGISPEFYSLSELWLLGEGEGPEAARRREGLYLPANHIMEERLLRRHLATMEDRGLNMIVIDMKDDYGRLRFVPENP
ncbi:MAG: hypothetical protein LBQ35_02415, partial [Spirochaetaceae bacterium]|nr:hypothetical protein [Spirochaetaceae bacterium]